MARSLVRASSQYLTLSSPAQIAISTGSFSMAFRINIDNSGGGVMVRENAGVTGFLAAEIDNNARLEFELFDSVSGANPLAAAGVVYSGGVWETGVVVRDKGAGKIRAYANGSVGADVTDGTGDLSNGGSLSWYLGARNDSAFGGSKYMSGILGEMAIWTTVLDATDVSNYNGGTGANCIKSANLVAYWKMNTNTSPEPDWKYGNDATLVNAPSYSAGPTVSYCDGSSIVPIIMHQRRQREG